MGSLFSNAMRSTAARVTSLLLAGATIIAGLFILYARPTAAHASTGLGSQIVCIVFSTLDQIGTPIPFLQADNCPATPPTSTGSLKVMKIVVGGTAQASDFSIHVKTGTSDVDGSPQPGTESGTSYIGLTPGSYTVSESGGPANYDAAFVGDCDASGHVTVASSSVPSVCTITNTYNAPAATMGGLVVVKQVSGGDASPSDFQIHVKSGATDVSGSPQAGSSTGTSYTLDAGTYAVSESDGPADYSPSYSASCPAGVALISAGATTTCTITNTFTGGGGGGGSTTGTLTVIKHVVTTAGGSAVAGDFTMQIAGVSPSQSSFPGSEAGTQITLDAGAYTVSESGGPTGYTLATSTGCTGTMTMGGSVVCTLTNTFVPVAETDADVSITKTVDNSAPAPGGTVTYTLTASNAGPASAANVRVTDVLPAGLAYVSDDSGGTYATSTGVWTIGSLADGSSTTLHITVTVGSDTAGQTITNAASISSDNSDPNTSDNSVDVGIVSTQPSGGGGGNNGGGSTNTGGGGGNGPIVGSLGGGGGGGPLMSYGTGSVLGISTSTESCDKYLTGFIKPGQSNDAEQVRRLQYVLGTLENLPIGQSGVYDATTIAAVNAFQSKYASSVLTPWGLKAPTSYVYLTTRKMVNEVYCHFTQNFPLTPAESQIVARGRAGSAAPKATETRPAAPARQTNAQPETAPVTAVEPMDQAPEVPAPVATATPAAPTNSFFNFIRRLFGR